MPNVHNVLCICVRTYVQSIERDRQSAGQKEKKSACPSFYPSFCAGRKTSKNVKFTLRSRDCMLREGMLPNKPKNRIDSVPNCTSVFININSSRIYIFFFYISKITGTYFSQFFFRNVYIDHRACLGGSPVVFFARADCTGAARSVATGTTWCLLTL